MDILTNKPIINSAPYVPLAVLRDVLCEDGLGACGYDAAKACISAFHQLGGNSQDQTPVGSTIEFCQTLAKTYQQPVFVSPNTWADIPPLVLSEFLQLQSAVEGLTFGAVLQGFSDAANCHEAFRTVAHRVHAWAVGDGDLAKNQAVNFRVMLEGHGLHLPTVASPLFFSNSEILPNAWDLTSYRVCLSLFPETYCNETLGAALFELDNPMPAYLSLLVDGTSRPRAARTRPNGTEYDLDKARADLLLAISLRAGDFANEPSKHTAFLNELSRGYATSFTLRNRSVQAVISAINDGCLGPEFQMFRLLAEKGKHAVGYHSKVRVAGVPFDELIRDDPVKCAVALAGSAWVSPGRPEESRLLKLTEFGQSMFRIFSDRELNIIKRWIASLPEDMPRIRKLEEIDTSLDYASPAAPFSRLYFPVTGLRQTRAQEEKTAELSARELYHRLLNVERYPESTANCVQFIRTWLARAGRHLEQGPNGLPFSDYTHKNLREWFENQSLTQTKSYSEKPAENIEKTRDEVIDEAVFLCPMILVDGGWIQQWARAGMVDTPIGGLLFKIFADEIGNGQAELNHPNVYRSLMHQMNVEILDHRTRAFCESKLFDEDAFMVPAFWLAIAHHPRRFLPETLGLNLAMELSGVGGAYRTARDELKHFGFSTTFVDLHNTIDNASTGHSAMAADAIVHHMDTIKSSGDANAANRHWRRVWTGYRALAIPQPSWKELFSRPIYNQ